MRGTDIRGMLSYPSEEIPNTLNHMRNLMVTGSLHLRPSALPLKRALVTGTPNSDLWRHKIDFSKQLGKE